VVMADTAASIWAAPVLSRDFHQEPAQFAGWLGLIILLAGLVGSIIGGVAADAGQRSRMPGGLLGGAVIAAACSIPASLFAVMPSVLGFALMLALLLTCGAIMGLITTTALAVMLPNELRGLCCGAFIVVGAIIGFGVAPTLVAGVSRLFGGESHLGAALAFTSIVTGVVTVIGFAAAMRAAARLHRP
jgi:MFS family permease